MKPLLTQDELLEINSNDCVSYLFSDNSIFLPVEYKVMHNSTDPIFADCVKTSLNGQIQLFYLTRGYRSLSAFISTVTAEQFLVILYNLFHHIHAVEKNGFLSEFNIDVSPDKIFINPETMDVRIIYVPINRSLYPSVSSYDRTVKNSIKHLIDHTISLFSLKSYPFYELLTNPNASADILMQKLRTSQIAPQQASSRLKVLKLSTMNEAHKIEFVINQREFYIGKKADTVDGFIPYNNAVSRVHCKIIHTQNSYFMIDEGSRNGTYVNTQRLIPQKAVELHEGDVVSIANIKFLVILI